MKKHGKNYFSAITGCLAVFAFILLCLVIPDESADAAGKTGLYHEGNVWNYYENGEIASDVTTLVKYNGSWWYVNQGRIDFSAKTLCKYNGSWWYINQGRVDFSAKTLCKYNGSWWYVNQGRVDFSAKTLCKYNGNWFYVSGGRVNFSDTTVVKYNGNWWYVHSGCVDFGARTLCRYNGLWWYISGGRIDFSDTTVIKYNGVWWYVKGGYVDFNARTLCKYNGTWWFIKGGRINFDTRTLVKYGANWFCVNNGSVDWGYSGNCGYKCYTYSINNGIVDFGRGVSKSNDWVSGLDVAKNNDKLIIVAAEGITSVDADVSMHQRDEDGNWYEMFSISGHVGYNGIVKSHEGDGKTPTGAYKFINAFGNLPDPGCRLKYIHCDSSYDWVDDSDSVYYNKLVSSKYVRKDWSSAENISSIGDRYNYVLALDYNKECIPGAGSAIFLHCGTNKTSGCVAIPDKYMRWVIQSVDENSTIVIDSKNKIRNY